MPDWTKIKAEYISTGISYRKLSEKYNVPPSTLYKRMQKGKWTELRRQREGKADAKIVEYASNQDAEKAVNIQTVADLLLNKIQQGVTDGSLIGDTLSIRQITAAIKDLKDIKGLKSEMDAQEQLARIEKLRKESRTEEGADIKVIISENLNDYSE